MRLILSFFLSLFGTTNTSFIFLAAIAALVAYLTLTHRDEDEPVDAVVDIDENGASTVVAALPDSAEE